MALHNGRLLLTPADPAQAPPLEPLLSALVKAGFLGPPVDPTMPPVIDQAVACLPGERFFDYIGFTGCAVTLGGASGTDSCHLRLEPPTAQPRFFCGRNTRSPRCPKCGKTLSDWKRQTAQWTAYADKRLHCSDCGGESNAWEWNWRGHAGFARVALTIENVFPGEVAPLPALINLLQQASGGFSWLWFMVQD